MLSWKVVGPGSSDTAPLLSDIDSDDSLSPEPGHDSLSEAISMRRGSNEPPWSDPPLGRPARGDDDELLLMFRRAIGINTANPPRNPAQNGPADNNDSSDARGIYGSVLAQERRKRVLHHTLGGMVWGCHGVQIVLGAALTCLGLSASEHPVTVTVLGAVNTATASFLALVKGKGIVEKLGEAEADFRQLKVWIEETDALLALGVIGLDRREVGLLIETAFRRYNACFGERAELDNEVE